MPDGLYPVEVNAYYGLNTKESQSRMVKGFCKTLRNIDLSVPGKASVRNGSDTLNDFLPPIGSGALELDGDSDYLSVPDDTAFDFSGGTWSVECFINIDDLSAANTIFSQMTDASNFVQGYINSSGQACLKIVSGGSAVLNIISSSSVISEGTEYHVIFGETGDDYVIIVDGSSVATSNSAVRPANYTGVFEIGRINKSPNEFFSGYIDEFRVLKGAQATDEPTEAYTSDANTSLLLHFEGVDHGTTITDSSSNAFTVTPYGTAALHVGLMSFTPRRIWNYFKPSDGTNKIMGNGDEYVFTMDNDGRWDIIASGCDSSSIFDGISFGDVFYMGNGIDDNLATDDGTATRKMGIDAPTFTPAAATGAAGSLSGDYLYKVTYYNSTTGHESNASAVSAQVSPSSEKVNLSGLTASTDTQVDKKRIYRTTDGGALFFYLAEIANATTTYEDNTADGSLGTTEAPTHNDPPNAFKYMEEWDGRIWGVQANSTLLEYCNTEYLTPAGAGLPEESFDADNFLQTQALIYGIKKAPGEVDQLWVHTSKGIFKVVKTYIEEDPYDLKVLSSDWFSICHYSILNVYNYQWFMARDGKLISVDVNGGIHYESYFIEPTLTAGNIARFDTDVQAVHYKNGTKNQARFIYPDAGETSPDIMIAANYLNRTPADSDGDSHAVMEYHTIAASCMAIVPNGDEKGILYTGHTTGAIKKQDTGTNDDGDAIDWELGLGYFRADLVPFTAYFPRYFIGWFEPLGNYSVSMRTDFDFGASGGQVYSLQMALEADTLDVDFYLDSSRLAGENALQKIRQDLGGQFNFISLTFFGQNADEIMVLNNIILMFKRVEGERI